MTDPSHIPAPGAGQEEAMPLPKFLMRIYYIFPIILYLPDTIFNFYVYSNGLLKTTQFPDVLLNVEFYLWAFLATGIVGMAWLLSVLAPWHWARGNHFQSIMCWFGVIIATAITTWCSMSFRFDQKTTPFPTDIWFAQIFHIALQGFSPTTVLVSISPPFWGLFWAIVQPAQKRRNASEQAEEFELKKLRMQQEAELKKMRAESNAQIRGAQLAGLAASMKAARTQIGAAITNAEAPADAPVFVEANATTLPALPPAADDTPPSDEGERPTTRQPLPRREAFVELVGHAATTLQSAGTEPNWQNITTEIERLGYEMPDRISVASALRTIGEQNDKEEALPAMKQGNKPRPGSSQYPQYIHTAAMQILANGGDLSLHAVAKTTGEQVEDVQQAILALRNQRLAKMKPGKKVADDPVLAAL